MDAIPFMPVEVDNWPLLLPQEVNGVGTKEFRINISGDQPIDTLYTFDKDIWISDIEVRSTKYEDLDNWSLFDGENAICETMYMANIPDNTRLSQQFQIFHKILAGTEIKFTYNNVSNIDKVVFFALGFLYIKV